MSSGIHNAVMSALLALLTDALITNVDPADDAIAGAVVLGPLQGEPMDPDEARISVEIHENDPDKTDQLEWADQVYEVEIGGTVTWIRRFSIRARGLFETSRETLDEARAIMSTLADRIEVTLLTSLVTASDGNEYVSRGPQAEDLEISVLQGGGPPDSYDFLVKIRFSVLTTRTAVRPE